MSTRTDYEIQIITPSSGHGWRAIGGRDGRFYFGEDSYVVTRDRDLAKIRRSIKQIQECWRKDYVKPRELRIVKIEVTTTYAVIE